MSSKIVQEKVDDLLAYVEELKQAYKKIADLSQKQTEEIDRLKKENVRLGQSLKEARFAHLKDLQGKEKNALKEQLDDLLKDIKNNLKLLK